jgi:integrase
MGSVYNRGTKAKPNWWVKYKDENGKRRAIASDQPTKDAAKTFVGAIEARIKNGMVGIVEKTDEDIARSTITLRALVDKFNAEYRPPKVKDIAEYRLQTKAGMSSRVLPVLGDKAATSITSDDVEKLRDALLTATDERDAYAGGSVSFTLSRLSRVYSWGVKKKIVTGSNPVSGVEHPDAATSLDFLGRDEVTALLHHLEQNAAEQAGRQVPQLRAMVATGIYAGLRKGELLGLRWIDVHLDRLQLTVARSYTLAPKSGKPRHVPIHPALAVILREWKKACPVTDEGLVFPVLDVCDGWKMGERRHMLHIEHYLKAAGCHVPRKPFHALRHTFASHFMMAGGNILTLQKLLGHATIEMTMIYAHLAPDFMAAEVARMSFPTTPAGVADMNEERRRRAVGQEGAVVQTDIQPANELVATT